MDSEHNNHERYDVGDPGVLMTDTWAETTDEVTACERCGAQLVPHRFRCTQCGMPVAMCMGSCGACVSPRCVGGNRD